uniref:ATP synthase F0 subunit 8 n=1 Tax=Trichinella spiralis TaxID=6334 RepID=Q9B8A5_TRISP|nr:ATP synthase F0 subunit 8 [Trichinella spiralis]AAK12903.1 putative ATP synthase F0 subunit 8 [Trichinella spiralis]ADB78093.1 ATP synthase F0 subunit 8 [Trichinella spiralis]AIW57096.1 ATP synthase F0 subunit 8 [Trichinella spiralis]QRN72129.1 ATP synthase F0 subunit 8 [Trichinella spiralis]QRN72142.1 ATP synthase F0 subunit 8 [Trichinella spiralis]
MLLLYQIPPMKLLSTLIALSTILWMKMMISPTSRTNPIKIK